MDNILETRVQGKVMEVIRWRFSNPELIEDPRLSNYIYNINPSLASIWIVSGAYEGEVKSRVPAIYVYSEDLSTTNLNPLHGYSIEVDDVDRVSGAMVDLDTGSVVILCEGISRAQAGAIGWEVYNLLRQYAPVLKREFNLFHISPKAFSSKNVSGGAEGGPPNKQYFATITVPWFRLNAWELEEPSP